MTHSPILIRSRSIYLWPCELGQIYWATQIRCRILSSEYFRQCGAAPVLPSDVANELRGKLYTAYKAFLSVFGIKSHRHQQRPWLHQSYEPRHGPEKKLRPRHSYDPWRQ